MLSYVLLCWLWNKSARHTYYCAGCGIRVRLLTLGALRAALRKCCDEIRPVMPRARAGEHTRPTCATCAVTRTALRSAPRSVSIYSGQKYDSKCFHRRRCIGSAVDTGGHLEKYLDGTGHRARANQISRHEVSVLLPTHPHIFCL